MNARLNAWILARWLILDMEGARRRIRHHFERHARPVQGSLGSWDKQRRVGGRAGGACCDMACGNSNESMFCFNTTPALVHIYI